jgi:two-component system, response regulator PdtaR
MRRYLLVDDNLAFAENVGEILRDRGADVTLAEGGRQALELVGNNRFDALVTDMRMPVMSGAKLVHEIRRIDPGLPAVVITAYTGEDDLLAAREEGLLAVLPKPVPLGLLGALLDTARRNGLVALVDDDAVLVDNLAEALRDRGFSAVTAHSVGETERLGGVQPFVALVDLRMPGSPDGAALERLLMKFPGLPVVVISGHQDAIIACKSPRIFPKPFETGQVLEEVERLWR